MQNLNIHCLHQSGMQAIPAGPAAHPTYSRLALNIHRRHQSGMQAIPAGAAAHPTYWRLALDEALEKAIPEEIAYRLNDLLIFKEKDFTSNPERNKALQTIALFIIQKTLSVESTPNDPLIYFIKRPKYAHFALKKEIELELDPDGLHLTSWKAALNQALERKTPTGERRSEIDLRSIFKEKDFTSNPERNKALQTIALFIIQKFQTRKTMQNDLDKARIKVLKDAGLPSKVIKEIVVVYDPDTDTSGIDDETLNKARNMVVWEIIDWKLENNIPITKAEEAKIIAADEELAALYD